MSHATFTSISTPQVSVSVCGGWEVGEGVGAGSGKEPH